MKQTDLTGTGRAAVLTLLVVLFASHVLAETASPPSSPAPAVLEGDFASAIVIEAETGMTLVAVNERVQRQPASMLKMMTELIVLERVAAGDLTLEDEVRVSAAASKMGGSQVYLAHNEVFTIGELLHALAIHSANDAAMALAEHVAGSKDAFVDLMNLRARELGMTDTVFHTVHGLPPGWRQEPDLTSARDMAILGREVARHHLALEMASTPKAPFRDGEFILTNPNLLVGRYRGLDGIKTGYTAAAGYCLTASAVQKDTRLISVVMGCSSDKARANETTRLLTYAFNLIVPVSLLAADGQPLDATLHVKGGKRKEAAITCGDELVINVPRDRRDDLVVEIRVPAEAEAPLPAGTQVGLAVALLDGREVGQVPVVTLEDVPRGNWLERLFN